MIEENERIKKYEELKEKYEELERKGEELLNISQENFDRNFDENGNWISEEEEEIDDWRIKWLMKVEKYENMEEEIKVEIWKCNRLNLKCKTVEKWHIDENPFKCHAEECIIEIYKNKELLCKVFHTSIDNEIYFLRIKENMNTDILDADDVTELNKFFDLYEFSPFEKKELAECLDILLEDELF